MKTLRWILILILPVFLQAQTASEIVNLFEQEEGFGVRAAAMGNAYRSVADDYSAIYWNPAGLAQVTDFHISGSIMHRNFGNDVQYLNNAMDDSRTYTKFQNIGLAYPFPVARGSFVIALGYQKINHLDGFADFGAFSPMSNGLVLDYGGGETYAFDRNVEQKYNTFRDGSMDQWSFGAAVDLSPNFSAGLALNFYGGSSTYLLEYEQTDVNNLYTLDNGLDFHRYEYRQRIISDYSGFEAKLGGLFYLTPSLKLGTSISFPFSITIDEQYSESDAITYDDPTIPVDEYDLGSGEFDYLVDLPFQFSSGISYEGRMFTLSGSIDYRDWSQMKFDVPSNRDADDYDTLLTQNRVLREDYRPVLSYAVGGEIKAGDTGLILRGGYRYLPSPEKNQSSDFDKKFYSFGIGYRVDYKTMINFAYVNGQWSRNSSDFVYLAEPVRQDISTSTYMFGLNFSL